LLTLSFTFAQAPPKTPPNNAGTNVLDGVIDRYIRQHEEAKTTEMRESFAVDITLPNASTNIEIV